MRIAIITSTEDCDLSQIPYQEALTSFLAFADEVILSTDSTDRLEIPDGVRVVRAGGVFSDAEMVAQARAEANVILRLPLYSVLHHKTIKALRRRIEANPDAGRYLLNEFVFVISTKAVEKKNAYSAFSNKPIDHRATSVVETGIFVYSYPFVFCQESPDREKIIAWGRKTLPTARYILQPHAHSSFVIDKIDKLDEKFFGFGGWGRIRD